jgi:hypothetical protein
MVKDDEENISHERTEHLDRTFLGMTFDALIVFSWRDGVRSRGNLKNRFRRANL